MEQLVNIGPSQRQTRRLMGIGLLLIALVWAVLLVRDGGIIIWAVYFILLQNGFVLLLEARHGVCPVNAYRGKQSMEGRFSFGQEDYAKPELLPRIKSVANRDLTLATVLALAITLLHASLI